MRDFDIVSWDVDGTLYDLARVKRAIIWRAVRSLMSVRVARHLRELAMLGAFRKRMAVVRTAGGVLGSDGIPPNRADILAAERRWYGPAIERVGLRPGLAALIEAFAGDGLRQIVVSDYQADYKLEVLGLAGRFERVYAGETVGHLKPSAELFRIVADDLGVSPRRILHIGDRDETDGAAARAVGCQVAIIGKSLAALTSERGA